MFGLFDKVKTFLLVILLALFLHLPGLLFKNFAFSIFEELNILLGISIFIVLDFTIVIYVAWLTTDVFLFFAVTNSFKDCLEALDVFLDPLFHTRVPVVFDGIISSTFQDIGYVSPFICLISIQYE